jgi:ribulose-5-phosphate 4-epimerase/fuculose-1-phosphate aldolase
MEREIKTQKRLMVQVKKEKKKKKKGEEKKRSRPITQSACEKTQKHLLIRHTIITIGVQLGNLFFLFFFFFFSTKNFWLFSSPF